MIKILLSLIIILCISTGAKAQCPLTSCKDSLPYTATKDTLIVSAGYVVNSWTILNAPVGASISNNNIVGLKPGTTSVLQLLASQGATLTVSIKIVTVAPAPIPPVIQRKWLDTDLRTRLITYDDGSKEPF